MSRRQRSRVFPVLMVLRENASALLVVVALLLFAWVATRWDETLAQCLEAYDRAPTAADTARVDTTPISARAPTTCLDHRRDGSLDRYRQSIEAGRVVRRKERFIEK